MRCYIKKFLLTAFLSVVLLLSVTLVHASDPEKTIYFFYGRGCPHCATVEEYFEKEDIYERYPVEVKEIYFDRDNAIFFDETLDELGILQKDRGVPLVVIGDKVVVGDKPIIENFVPLADIYMSEKAKTDSNDVSTENTKDINANLTILAVIGASLVDAINPCAFAVLIILMSTILAAGDSKKALRAGFAFAASIFISYFLMGLGLYTALGVGGLSGIFFKIVGWMAIILGLFNLKDYFWYGKGFIMEVPMSWRPRLKKLIGSVTTPVGAFGVGFLVSLFLLPCTSGPYIVILGMLAENVMRTKAVLYLLLYNLIFVSPMLIISYAVYRGFDPKKAEDIRQKRLKTLHLIAGIVLILMGLAIVSGLI
jgi:cytochrome c biogenesis protein CcdA/glutaredoxin